MIMGMVAPSSGHIEFPPGMEGKRAGYCPQNDMLFEFLTIRQQLKYYSLIAGVGFRDQQKWVETIAKRTLLDDRILDKFPIQLSGGMKRRATLAMSLISDRKTLVLDEPTTGLDPITRMQVWETILQIQKRSGQAVLMTSHTMSEVETLCDRVGILHNNELVTIGPKESLVEQYSSFLKVH
jgi:ABC-type multidrug transport system ATPase subunit